MTALALGLLAAGMVPAGAAIATSSDSYPTVAVHAAPWRQADTLWGRAVASWSDTVTAPVAMTNRTVAALPYRGVDAGKPFVTFSSPALEAMFTALADTRSRLDLARRHRQRVENRKARAVTTEEVKFQADADVLARREALNRSWGALRAVLAALGHDASRDEIVAELDKSDPVQLAQRYGTLVRPYAARVHDSDLVAGMHVAKGAPLFRLQGGGGIFIDVHVAPSRLAALREGEVQVKTGPGGWQPLSFAGAAPAVDPDTGLAVVRYALGDQASGLRSGEWVRVRHRGPPQPALWVPATAVVARNGESYCIVAAQGGYKAIKVRAGDADNGMIPVLKGLSPGDAVVTAGAYEMLYRDLGTLMQPSD